MTDWKRAYEQLKLGGFKDPEIAELAGVTRRVVCLVRNGTYPYKHEPGHEGGQRVQQALANLAAQGKLPLEETEAQ